MTWATPTEASTFTGDSITQSDLDKANAVIEIYVQVTEDALGALKPKDIRLLKKMESFQAAWMNKQVEYTGRSDVDLVDQDGLGYSKGDKDTHTLAPLAKKAYSQLSWMRTRTLDALTPDQAKVLRGVSTAETMGDAFGDDEFDENWGKWRPI